MQTMDFMPNFMGFTASVTCMASAVRVDELG